MNKTAILLGLAVLIIGGAAFVPQVAQAYRGDFTTKGPNYSQEREEAIENADLEKFRLSCTTGRMCQVVDTQEKLDLLQKMHAAMEKGDAETARELRTQLGLGTQNGSGQRQGLKNRMGGNGECGRTNR